MRYIEQTSDRKLRRKSGPSEEGGPRYWVDTQGSHALVDGVLYKDGRPVEPGDYDLPVPGEEEPRRYEVRGKGQRVKEVIRGGRGKDGGADRGAGAPGTR